MQTAVLHPRVSRTTSRAPAPGPSSAATWAATSVSEAAAASSNTSPRASANVSSASAGPLSHLLKSYTTANPMRSPSPLPASSRVDPNLNQRAPPPTSASPLLWTLSTWIAFVQFAFAKGLHIVWSLLKHFFFGPQRKSWGYRMTFICSFMRNVAQYTDLADITLVRRLVSITALIPLPADAVVTPITFVVPRRRETDACRGFLRDWDIAETGVRELTGEWVVGNDVWKRLKSERRARWHAEMRRRSTHGPSRLSRGITADNVEDEASSSSVSASPVGTTGRLLSGAAAPPGPSDLRRSVVEGSSLHRRRDSDASASSTTSGRRSGTPEPELEGEGAHLTSRRERVIYYVHGGAYYVGNATTHRLITIGVSKSCNARVFAITYRLAPEAAFPLPLLDVLHGYLRLLAPPLSIPPENIILAGDSAGGGLSLALCMYLRDNGYQLPAGLVLMSPWVDLTMSCGSWDENADSDVVPQPETDDHLNPVWCYLGSEGMPHYMTHPYASPLFGDMRDLPPMLIQSGESEVLRDEITLLAHKATLAGVHVTHELYEDMVHVFQTFTWLPAAHAAISSVGRWVRQTLPRIEWEMRQAAEAADMAAGYEEDQEDETETPVPGISMQTTPARTPTGIPGTPRRAPPSGALSVDVDNLPSGAQSPAVVEGSSSDTKSALPIADADALHVPTRPPCLRRSTTQPLRSHSHSRTPTSPRDDFAFSRQPSATSVRTMSSPHISRRRRQTASTTLRSPSSTHSNSYAHLSPAPSPSLFPLSPTPSLRRRLRAPTISSISPASPPPGGMSHPTTPTTRSRSASHSDIFHLVEGYVEGGAANETVVYAPGGEIRSVGHLGDEDMEVLED